MLLGEIFVEFQLLHTYTFFSDTIRKVLSPKHFFNFPPRNNCLQKHNRHPPPPYFLLSLPHLRVLLFGAARVLYLSAKLLWTWIGKGEGGITPFAAASPIPYGASESDVLPNAVAVRREVTPVSSSVTPLTRWWLFPFYPAFVSELLVLYNIRLLYSPEFETCTD